MRTIFECRLGFAAMSIQSTRNCAIGCLIGSALVLAACSGKSKREEAAGGRGTARGGSTGGTVGGTTAAGGSAGAAASSGTTSRAGTGGESASGGAGWTSGGEGGASGDLGGTGSGGTGALAGMGAAGEAGGASPTPVDANGRCPGGLDYFISIGGDLPSRRLTQSCSEDTANARVPVYDPALSLDPSDKRWEAFVGCDGAERVEVWRLPPYPAALSAAGFYTAPDGTTYSTCGTSRLKSDGTDCSSKVGTLSVTESASSSAVLEGSYAMTVHDGDGKAYAINGQYRVCSYVQP
jgi:hypothetical protein